jgi:hypothetical protein
LFRALIDAGKFFKNGKSKVTTQKSSLIPAGCWLQEIEVLVSSKFLTSPDEYGAAIQQGIEDGCEAFEGEDDE